MAKLSRITGAAIKNITEEFGTLGSKKIMRELGGDSLSSAIRPFARDAGTGVSRKAEAQMSRAASSAVDNALKNVSEEGLARAKTMGSTNVSYMNRNLGKSIPSTLTPRKFTGSISDADRALAEKITNEMTDRYYPRKVVPDKVKADSKFSEYRTKKYEDGLTQRTFDYFNKEGIDVKSLEDGAFNNRREFIRYDDTFAEKERAAKIKKLKKEGKITPLTREAPSNSYTVATEKNSAEEVRRIIESAPKTSNGVEKELNRSMGGKVRDGLYKVGALTIGGALVFNMFDNKGQQSNSQLYGQQQSYQ